ncbi:MAG: hypothetical protein J0L92_36670 [Deltaproteobacteria bacterium]|nr:hypothetical protein [Deltaproteobacteria bacterium]
MGDAYRDEREALRSKLEESERELGASRERVRALEAEVSIATSTPSSGASVLRIVVTGLVCAILGAVAVLVAHRGDASVYETRWLSLHSAEIGVTRLRDDRSCRLRFERTRSTEPHGPPNAVCITRVTCERTLYDGLTMCADHQHLTDTDSAESDGDGRIEVDLLAGTMTVDDEAFRF